MLLLSGGGGGGGGYNPPPPPPTGLFRVLLLRGLDQPFRGNLKRAFPYLSRIIVW